LLQEEAFAIQFGRNQNRRTKVHGTAGEGKRQNKSVPACRNMRFSGTIGHWNNRRLRHASQLDRTCLGFQSGAAGPIGNDNYSFLLAKYFYQRPGRRNRLFVGGTTNDRIPHQASQPGQPISILTGAYQQVIIGVPSQIEEQIKNSTVPKSEDISAREIADVCFVFRVFTAPPESEAPETDHSIQKMRENPINEKLFHGPVSTGEFWPYSRQPDA